MEVSEYLQTRHQNVICNPAGITKEQWPPNQPKLFTSVIIMYHKEMYMSKGTLRVSSEMESGASASLYSHVPQYGKPGEHSKSILDLFVPLQTNPSVIKPNTLLIEGAPGIGKTMLANEIALNWKSIPLLKERQFLFLIYLRDPCVQQFQEMRDLLNYVFQHSKLEHKINTIEQSIHRCNGANLVIIFDGYDELPHRVREISFVASIIKREWLQSCLLVITSRPSGSENLHDYACRRVEVLGFTEADREDYIEKALGNLNKQNYIALKKHFKKFPAIDSLCRIPLNMTILVYLFREKNCLPESQTELFEKFIVYTISHFLTKSDNAVEFSSFPTTGQHNAVLEQLGKLSFESLKEDKIVFTQTDLKNICSKYIKACKGQSGCPYGLLKQSSLSGEPSYSFLHLTVQEYLAAWYLSNKEWFWGSSEIKSLLEKYFFDTKFFNMWVLYVGLTKGRKTTFKDFITGSTWWQRTWHGKTGLTEDILVDHLKCLHLFQCFKEANDEKSCQMVCGFLKNKTINLSNYQLLQENINTLCFAITQSSECCLTELNLSNCRIGDDGCNYIHKQLIGAACKISINTLNLSRNQLTKGSANIIPELIMKLESQQLILSGNQFCYESAVLLIK